MVSSMVKCTSRDRWLRPNNVLSAFALTPQGQHVSAGPAAGGGASPRSRCLPQPRIRVWPWPPRCTRVAAFGDAGARAFTEVVSVEMLVLGRRSFRAVFRLKAVCSLDGHVSAYFSRRRGRRQEGRSALGRPAGAGAGRGWASPGQRHLLALPEGRRGWAEPRDPEAPSSEAVPAGRAASAMGDAGGRLRRAERKPRTRRARRWAAGSPPSLRPSACHLCSVLAFECTQCRRIISLIN